MPSKIISLLLISILVPGSVISVWAESSEKTPRTQNDTGKVSKLMEKALGIPAGSPVEARLQSKEKLWGRMAGVSDDGVDLRFVKDGKFESRKIPFSELQSIKLAQKMSKRATAMKVGLGVMSLMTLAGTILNLTRD